MSEPMRLFLLNPATVFAARVNQASFTYPLAQVTFDGVTTGSYTAPLEGMTVLFGSAAGLDDLGRSRIRKAATTDTLYFGRSSEGTLDGEVALADNIYITVLWLYEVWAKIPYITPDGTMYKDHDIGVGGLTINPPPVANVGQDAAGTIDATSGKLRLTFPESTNSSFATADSATITGYLWGLDAGAALVAGYASTDSQVQIDFDPGFHYVSLTVTDSNGRTHKARAVVYARDPDDDLSIANFQVVNHTLSRDGQQISVRVLEDIPFATYPQGTVAMLWEGEPSEATSRGHMLFTGWVGPEPARMSAGREGTLKEVTLELVDVAGRLQALPGFPQELSSPAVGTPARWTEMNAPTLDKYLHYLLHWHSTALELCDFTWTGTGDDYSFMRLSSGGTTLWEQVAQRARAFVPSRSLTFSKAGKLSVLSDPMLQEADDRSLDSQANLDDDDWSDINYTQQRYPRVHWLHGNAVKAGLVYGVGDVIDTFFCIAPGDAPGQGSVEQTMGEQLAISQDDLNRNVGHAYARLNAQLSKLRITLPYGPLSWPVWRFIDPAEMRWVKLSISADEAAQRGLTFTLATGLPESLSIRYEYTRTGLVRTAELVWEKATLGRPAKTVVKPTVPSAGTPQVPVAPDPYPGATPPPFDGGLPGAGENLVLLSEDGKLYRTADFQTLSGAGGPTWDAVDLGLADAVIYSWVVDPFSPLYRGLGSTVNAYAVTQNYVYRLTDIFGATPGVAILHTFTYAADTGSQLHRTIQASFGRYFETETDNPWLLVVSYYANTAGHTGTWALRSLDGGQTWAAETQVTAHYETSSSGRRMIGVYTSPRTPGLAYTAAYAATAASPNEYDGYVSTDWGETWALTTGTLVDDPASPLPYWGTLHGGVCTVSAGAHTSLSLSVTSANGEGAISSGFYWLLLAPPTNAVRVRIEGTWSETRTADAASGGQSYQGQVINGNGTNATATTDTLDKSTGATINGGPLTQAFVVEYTRIPDQADWILSRDDMLASSPTVYDGYCYIRLLAIATTTGSRTATESLSVNLTIDEIELEDGTIYAPDVAIGAFDFLHQPAGNIHVPWQDNIAEAVIYYGKADATGTLLSSLINTDGTTLADVSPAYGGGDYGIDRASGAQSFALRAFDLDRRYLTLAGYRAGSPDLHGLFVSDDGGATWSTAIVPAAPTTDVPAVRQAAFGADVHTAIYAWGTYGFIQYSADFGTTFDDKVGNLATANGGTLPVRLIGIAGGEAPEA